MNKHERASVTRRRFLTGAAVGAAAAAVSPVVVAQEPASPSAAGAVPLSKAAETGVPPDVEGLTADRPGADFRVDVIKGLGFEYICANPGSSFRGLHESLVNYGRNVQPEFITCCHEESSVGMAHGYAKVEGRPLGVLLHSNV